MKVILQTERLFLRELVEGDIPDLKEILQDRRVMYAYGHDFSDADGSPGMSASKGVMPSSASASGRRWKRTAARWWARRD